MTTTMTPAILEARDLTKAYRLGETTVDALRGVSLTVAAGEFVALMGPSGSGKSTLLQLLGGLDRPTAGEVVLDGDPVSPMSDDSATRLRRRKTGFVFQFFNLIPLLDVAENVGLPFTIAGDDPRKGIGRRAGPRRDRPRRPDRQGAPPARPAVGGRAAAGRDRPGARHPADPPAGRRADRQPRLHDRDRDPRGALAVVRRARPDDRARDPRREGGRLRRPRLLRPGRPRSATRSGSAGGPTTRPRRSSPGSPSSGSEPMGGLSAYAWRSLAARPLRTLLTIVGIALGVAVLFAALATNAAIDGVDRPDRPRHSSGGPTCGSRASPSAACRRRSVEAIAEHAGRRGCDARSSSAGPIPPRIRPPRRRRACPRR